MGYPLTIMQQRHPLLRWLLAALLVVSSYTNSGNMSQEFVTCPFNSAHTVSRHRLQNHVEKCKKTTPNINDFSKCPYNPTHYFRKGPGKDEEHFETCRDALEMKTQAAMWNIPASYAPAVLVENACALPDEESWATEGPSFKPEVLAKSAPHMMLPQGLTKSKRKAHREAERQRLRELEAEKVVSSSKVIPPPTTYDQEVRQPRKGLISANSDMRFESLSLSRNSMETSTSYYSAQDSVTTSSDIGRGRGLLGGWKLLPETRARSRGPFVEDDFPVLK